MNFHPIERTHLPECAALFLDVFNSPPWNENWSREAVTERLEDCYHTPHFYGFIATIEDAPVAFAIGTLERWDQSKHFYLKEMCVSSGYQRAGVGTALMSALEEIFKNQGVQKLYLHTAHDTQAHAFYEKQGFYVSPKMIMMAKWLAPK